jgi:chemosensory pili system protein ChpA (sensor histidine kinase/response regulator)
MEQLEDKTTEFNQTVIEALDEVFAALEAESVVSESVAGTAQALGCYIEQVRHIRAAASTAEMPGLNWVCSLVERNLISLHKQNRLLSKEEFSLLSEWPELLASYALNHGACKIDELIWHLGASSWPAPLLEVDADELRHLLECDPGNCCCESEASHGLFLVPDVHVDRHIDSNIDPHTSIHDALDGLIVVLALDDAAEGAAEFATAENIFSRYAQALQVLSSCAVSLSMDTLASASDAFSQVLMLRAERPMPPLAAEHNLLNLFPMLAMECIAAPEDASKGLALLDLAFDAVWNASEEAEAAPDEVQSVEEMPAQMSNHIQTISHAMLALLAKEFSLMSDLLAEDLAAVLISGLTDEARHDALGNYADVLVRIGATAESLGLTALSGVFSHLHDTVNGLCAGISPAQNTLLEQLPESLLAYLACPNDQAQSRELMALVAASVWPNPMQESLAEQWVRDLSQVTIIDEVEQAAAPRLIANQNDVSLVLPKDINVELLDGLLQELPVQVASFTNAIKKFAVGNGSMAEVEQAKRAAHTLKGAANTVGVAGIANLTHHLEDLLIGLTEKNTLPSHSLAKLLMDASDCLEAMSETVLGVGTAPVQALEVLQQVLNFIHHGDTNIDDACSDIQILSVDHTSVASVVAPSPNEVVEPETTTSEAAQMLRVPAMVVDELLRLAGENVISNAQIQERLRQTQKQSKAIQKQDALFQKLIAELENLVDVRGIAAPRQATPQSLQAEGDFDPLEFERYSELHTITSQLIEARTDASEMSGKIDEELNALGELLEVQRRLQMENQHAVIRTRLVPVSTLVSRLQRSVRQTCRLLDKQVELKIIGEATSIDSNMLQELADPLMHVLRNAVDHGIEFPDDRIAANKSAFGLIELSFAREGNAIVVRCKDDGAGLDYAAIRRTAMQRNMIVAGAKPTDEELGRLILMPGFSTRDTTTQTSGRGIGMDVVYTSILEMKGSLKLLSNVTGAGSGLTVELRLPATLLSEHTLMARIGGKLLAVSSRRILDIHYITPEQISFIGDQQVYRVGDAVHQLLRLDNLLGLPDKRTRARELGYPVLITSTDAGASCAILVQELVDGREVVVKKLGKYVPKIPGTIGAVILGDGSVAPVIDLPELLRASSQGQQFSTVFKPQNQQSNQVPTSARSALATRIALIVDDSLSARRAAAQIMRDAGYEVRTAIDGLDAVAMLETLVPDVILVDMEMPRMNGLELTSHVRGRAALKNIPIIMITSRSTEKHRQQGDAAGVNAYLVKPFNEDKLLQHIDNLVGFAR